MTADALFVSDFVRVSCAAEGKLLSGYLEQMLESRIGTAGIAREQWELIAIHPSTPPGGKDVSRFSPTYLRCDLDALGGLLKSHPAKVIVTLGAYALRAITGLDSLDKWQSSVVRAKAEFGGRKVIPMYHPEDAMKDFPLTAHMALACHKAAREMQFPEIRVPERKFILGPPIEQSLAMLAEMGERAEPIAVDIEAGNGQINTVGFAWSATSAVAIKTLPELYSPSEHLALWQALAKVLEGPRPKVLQNFIFEATYLARYGVGLRHVHHDTMWAMKFLHPELEKGLDNVGRFFTPFPYWKDDNANWAMTRDWPRQLAYNCKDTTGTFAAFEAQREDLKGRNLERLFYGYVMLFAPVIQEMCCRGMALDPQSLIRLKEKLEAEAIGFQGVFDRECEARLGHKVNAKSPKQVKDALKRLGMKIPLQHGKESADRQAIIKLRKKHPDDPVLSSLLGLSAKNKQLSTYVNFEYDRDTDRVHYSLDGCATESGRWSGNHSAWGEGFNPMAVPRPMRNCFIASPGRKLIQVALQEASTRYLAWDAPEPRLIQLIEAGLDLHRYVAGYLFKKPEPMVTWPERKIAKLVAEAASYAHSPRAFSEESMGEGSRPFTEAEAKRLFASYLEIFPALRTRQRWIEQAIRNRRRLTTALGRERTFFGRMDEATFRSAYAYGPESVASDILGCLTLKLWREREAMEAEFLLQAHDTLLIEAPPGRVEEIAEFARDLSNWHPKVMLPGGPLLVPVEVRAGTRWGSLEPA